MWSREIPEPWNLPSGFKFSVKQLTGFGGPVRREQPLKNGMQSDVVFPVS
jgi:hypothetical protein